MQQTEKIYIRNRYKIEKVLNRGGFGITYLAEDTELCQKVVLKKYCPIEDVYGNDRTTTENHINSNISVRKTNHRTGEKLSYEKGKQDFLKEARIMSSLFEVKEVVKVLDYFEENEDAYIVMEYVNGITLREHIENRNDLMNFDEAWAFLLPVINALQKVHEKQLVHRDINPDNIIVREDGTLKLIDFGSAREYVGDKITMTAIVKRGYAPLEQYMTKGKQGPWTDIYSICATIYEMITGVILESSMQRMEKDNLYPPSSYGNKMTLQQEETLMKGLSLDYKKRFQSISQLKESLLLNSEKEEAHRQKVQQNKRNIIKRIAITCIIGGILISGLSIGRYQKDLKRAKSEQKKEQSVNQYPRDSKERLLLLRYLVQYGKYRGVFNGQRVYELPEWTVRKVNVRCDEDLFPQNKGEYISYLRRKNIPLKLKDKAYRGVIYMGAIAGSIQTEFMYTETYDIGQNCGMKLIYDIATHEVTRAVFYRKNPKQKMDYLIKVASLSILFFAKDWELPPKKTPERIKELVDDYEKEERNEGYYSWIDIADGCVGCRTQKWCGTALQVFR